MLIHRFMAPVLCWLPGLVQAEEPPNVVIFFTDDQGTLDARCYGSEHLRTPNIDELAATGTRFTQAYAHSFCCPSRAALLTGRHPQRGGVNSWVQGDLRATEKGINMALEEVTLAEALKAGGYRTALFGKWHLGAHPDHGPTRQGFDEFFGIRGGFIDNSIHYFLQGDGFHDLYEGTQEVWAKGKYFPQMIVDRANQFIERNKQQPFFLYLALNTPHYPEQPPEKHLKLFAHLKEPRRTYAAFTYTTDDLIGQVMSQLETLSLRRKTILIFMSDNGHQSYQSYDFFQVKIDNHRSGYPKGHRFSVGDGPNDGGGNTGKWIGHKGTFLEGGVRVPAIISFPAKLPSGQARDQAVTVMDWYPTILELCGVK
ncbi:MAG: sulfatase-like hydrolase/transferase, partial [Opitutales bacterium]